MLLDWWRLSSKVADFTAWKYNFNANPVWDKSDNNNENAKTEMRGVISAEQRNRIYTAESAYLHYRRRERGSDRLRQTITEPSSSRTANTPRSQDDDDNDDSHAIHTDDKPILLTRMWANAQRDGRPAEYRWRPLFNAAKFGWRPLLECRAVTLLRRKTRWNYLGCPKLTKRSQPLEGRSSPYCKDMWRRYCCLTSFFSDCRYVP